ncbi:MAG: hypothetical protein LBF21_02065, partial [Puniceicoccales bacterium]|nr:hypothetical protein [Puniceicoccales bacterium]
MKVMGVFCISCSSILVCAGKEGEGEPAPQVITLQMALREINGILNGERNEEEGGESAPEAIADPLRLVLWGTDDVKWVLNMGVVGILCFAEVFVRQLIRNERFGIPPEGRVLIEETWDHC